MKTLFKSLMVLIIISLAKNSYPQKQEILENFKVFETNGQVLLNWQIVQGSTCFGIGILQSTNQLDFTEIGHIPGVCGASNDPLGYQFIDSNPIKNQFNYYRLNLGGYGYSEILAIKIIEEPRIDLQFFPNPVVSTSKLYFENKNDATHFLFIYNLAGSIVATLSTNLDYYTISNDDFTSGIYFFLLKSSSNNLLSKGKKI